MRVFCQQILSPPEGGATVTSDAAEHYSGDVSLSANVVSARGCATASSDAAEQYNGDDDTSAGLSREWCLFEDPRVQAKL